MEKIFDAKGEIVASGMHPGVANSQVPLWAEGNNFLFKDRSAKIAPSQSVLFNKLNGRRGLGIKSIDNDGSPAVIWGDQLDLYRGLDDAQPTGEVVTRVSEQIFDGFESGEATNWTAISGAVLSDDAVEFIEGTGSFRIRLTSAATTAGARQDLAARNLTNKIITIRFRVETGDLANLSTAGDAISFYFGSTASMADNWVRYDIPHTDITAEDTWFTATINLALPAAASSGTVVLSAIISYQIEFNVLVTNSTDFLNFDDYRILGNYTGSNTNKWSIVQFGQSILATNGIDAIQYLVDVTTGLFVDLDTVSDLASTFRCEILQKLGPYIIAFNTDQDNTEARWNTEDDLTVWTPIASNSARDINLRDMNSDIVTVLEFGSGLIVVGKNRAHVFQFIGPPFFHGAQKLIDGIGAVGKDALVQDGRLIYGMGPSGLFVTDGSSAKYIDDPDIHKFIYEDPINGFDPILGKLATAWHDTKEDVIYFSYPTKSGGGFTVGYQPTGELFSMHDYWRTAASAGELWENPILLDDAGNVWVQGESGASGFQSSVPLGLSDEAEVTAGYGELGYGQGGYGGKTVLG